MLSNAGQNRRTRGSRRAGAPISRSNRLGGRLLATQFHDSTADPDRHCKRGPGPPVPGRDDERADDNDSALLRSLSSGRPVRAWKNLPARLNWKLDVTGFARRGGTANTVTPQACGLFRCLACNRGRPKQLCLALRVWQILPSPCRGLQNDS